MKTELECAYYANDILCKKNDALAARVKELEGALAWQPIETAPKDATWFLAWAPTWAKPRVVCFAESHYWGTDANTFRPTLWQPLPEPPDALAGKGAE